MAGNKTRILVVDDEPKYVFALQAILVAAGYDVLPAADGLAALDVAASERPALILLDIRLPGLSGLETCARIREFSLAPIILLTALAEKEDIARGLDAGADDYVTKPFSTDELLARVRAALRRAEYPAAADEPVFESGDLRIDYAGRRVEVAGREIHLTPTEYRLLRELARAAGRLVPDEVILENVWGPGYAGEDRLIPRNIHRLRQKIEPDPAHPRHIITVPGHGYKLERRS